MSLLLQQLQHYFPELKTGQLKQLLQLPLLYREWNDKINVISRKDIENLGERHILHSLTIAKFISFTKNTRVLDAGTGGGFPGIPLAIVFPETNFYLADSVEKKIKVVNAIADSLQLKNVAAKQARVEEMKLKFDFVVSRAVASMKTMYDWTKQLIASESKNKIENGWIFLKGGDLNNEIKELKRKVTQIPVSNYFEEGFFSEKYLLYFAK